MRKNRTVHGLTIHDLNCVPIQVLVSLHITQGIDFHTHDGKIDNYFVP